MTLYSLWVQQVRWHQQVLSLQQPPTGRQRWEHDILNWNVNRPVLLLCIWNRNSQQVQADPACRWILCVPCGLSLQPRQPLLCLPWHQQDPEQKIRRVQGAICISSYCRPTTWIMDFFFFQKRVNYLTVLVITYSRSTNTSRASRSSRSSGTLV